MYLGLLKPTNIVSRLLGSPLEVYRCELDGGIVTNHQCPSDGAGHVFPHKCQFAAHAGHKVKQPVMLKPHEVLMIQLRMIK